MKAGYFSLLGMGLFFSGINLANATPIATLTAPTIAPYMQAGDKVDYTYLVTNYTPQALSAAEIISGNSMSVVTLSTPCNIVPANSTCSFTVSVWPVLATYDSGGVIADTVTVTVGGQDLQFTSPINTRVALPTYIPNSLIISPSANTLLGGSHQAYKATASYSNANDDIGTFDVTASTTWSSSVTSVANIGSSSGVVATANTGSTTISATQTQAGSATTTLNVTNFGYVVSSNQNSTYPDHGTAYIAQCPLDITGSTVTGACTQTNPYTTASVFWQTTIDPRGHYLYTVTQNPYTVTYCTINAVDGTLSACQSTGNTANVAAGMAINPAGNFAYVGSNDGTVNICVVASNGSLSGCTSSQAILATTNPIMAISFNAAGTKVYLAGLNQEADGHHVALCNSDQLTGKLSSCVSANDTGMTTDTMWSMALAPGGNYLYFGLNNGNGPSSAWSCALNPNSGLLSNCATAAPNGIPMNFPSGMTINLAGTVITLADFWAYQGGYSQSTTSCTLLNGVFSDCTEASNPSNVPQPIGIIYR